MAISRGQTKKTLLNVRSEKARRFDWAELRQRIQIWQFESDAAARSDGARAAGLAHERIGWTIIEG